MFLLQTKLCLLQTEALSVARFPQAAPQTVLKVSIFRQTQAVCGIVCGVDVSVHRQSTETRRVRSQTSGTDKPTDIPSVVLSVDLSVAF